MAKKGKIAAASASFVRKRTGPSDVEVAMIDELKAIEDESTAIWTSKLPLKERQKRIAKLNDPKNVLKRKLAARAGAKAAR